MFSCQVWLPSLFGGKVLADAPIGLSTSRRLVRYFSRAFKHAEPNAVDRIEIGQHPFYTQRGSGRVALLPWHCGKDILLMSLLLVIEARGRPLLKTRGGFYWRRVGSVWWGMCDCAGTCAWFGWVGSCE
jgi:hypothetical protein